MRTTPRTSSTRTRLRTAGLAACAVTGLVVALGVVSSAPTAAAAPLPTCDGRPATIVGTRGDDILTGTDGDNVIWAGPGDDVVHAGKGDDVVCGNGGMDLLIGGAGDDRVLGGHDRERRDRSGFHLLGDTIHGGTGDDVLDAGFDARFVESFLADADNISWSTSRSGVHIDLSGETGTSTGEGADTLVLEPQRLVVYGSPLADVITGSEESDRLIALGGDDQVDGRGGDDQIDADGAPDAGGDDVVHGGDGDDTVDASSGLDELHGGPGSDVLRTSSARPARIYGDEGSDGIDLTLTLGSGYVADGGAGRDDVFLNRPDRRDDGHPPPDAQVPLAHLDLAEGTIGVDWLPTASSGSLSGIESVGLGDDLPWDVLGSDGDDDISAGDLRLHASMRGGNDDVGGSYADDVVRGGTGEDSFHGTLGVDTCISIEHADDCDSVA